MVLTDLDVAPRRAFARAGVDPRSFGSPENSIRDTDLARLLSECTTLTRCPHFGLFVGQRFTLGNFGAIGDLMRNSATVGEALQVLLLRLHRYDRMAVPVLLRPDRSTALLCYSVRRHGTPALRQVYDAALAIAYRLLRELCGKSWEPWGVQFACERPSDVSPYRRVFGTSVRFDAEVSGVVFAASWLDRCIAGADRVPGGLLSQTIGSGEPDGPMSFAEEVQGVVQQLVLSGAASAGNLAHVFGIHERTMRQRLRAEGTNLQRLLDDTRFELAQQLLQDTALPLSKIASALHFSDQAVFSRAFRSWASASPRRWRASHARETF